MQLALNVSQNRFCLILNSTRIRPYQFFILCDWLDGLELIGDGQLPSKARPHPPAEVRPHQDREASDVPLGLDGVGPEGFDDDRFSVLEVVDVDADVVVDVERRLEGVDEKLAIFAENQVLVEAHFQTAQWHDMAILLFGNLDQLVVVILTSKFELWEQNITLQVAIKNSDQGSFAFQ